MADCFEVSRRLPLEIASEPYRELIGFRVAEKNHASFCLQYLESRVQDGREDRFRISTGIEGMNDLVERTEAAFLRPDDSRVPDGFESVLFEEGATNAWVRYSATRDAQQLLSSYDGLLSFIRSS